RRPRGAPDRLIARGLLAGVLRDVVGDGLDLCLAQLALERPHPALAVRDAVDHELLRRLRLVEVRADGAGRPCRPERVATGAAGGREDRLAVGRVPTAASRLRRVRGIDDLTARVEPGDGGDVG